eukprot:5553410-Prymnesium_polylepis.2
MVDAWSVECRVVSGGWRAEMAAGSPIATADVRAMQPVCSEECDMCVRRASAWDTSRRETA